MTAAGVDLADHFVLVNNSRMPQPTQRQQRAHRAHSYLIVGVKEPGTPSGDQRRAVERARELAEAAATVQTLAAYLGVSTQHPGEFFYTAYTAAIDRMRDLLAKLDEAGPGRRTRTGTRRTSTSPPGRSRLRRISATARPRCSRRRSAPFWRASRGAPTTCRS
jgi:hypothetical protein